MAQLKEGSIIKKSTGDEVIATVSDIPDVPTKTSDLENDSGFLDSLPAHSHDDMYYTESEVDSKLDEKVGNSRVLTDVPANAKFTDTVYSHPPTHPANMITGLPTSLPADGGNADTVGGFTVGVNVPANAKFTDTVYSHPATHSADMITDGTTNKAYTAAEKTKLSGIATGANKYTHPSTHPSSIIVQDANNRFVTDAEKSAWNGKQNALGYTPVNKAGDNITGQLGVESATFPVIDIARNTSATGGGLYGGARLQRKTTNPANGVGIGFYFQAPNSNKAMTHAGMFGGALGTINAGSEKGEIVLSPSYAGQDPYARRDFIVRAISASKAEAELNGKLRTEQTLASDPINTVATKKYVDDNKTAEYTHPSSHPASMITESSTKRFVSDTERGQWNDKTKTITSATEPNLNTGDQWHKEI